MSQRLPRLGVALLMIVATALTLGLAALGWGGWSALIAHPARAGACVVTALSAIAVIFTDANLEGLKRPDTRNRWILLPFVLLAVTMTWLPAATDRLELWTLDGDAVRYLGLVLLIFGGVLRVGPMFVLGRRFTFPFASQQEHRLVTTGFYRFVRHPSYLGLMVGGIGWVLVFRSGIGLLLLVLLLPMTGWGIRAEEDLLMAEFGEDYAAYRRRTWRVLPFVY
jgi:protein-S-isoprenylcysteine O-methyltransferase Ste14